MRAPFFCVVVASILVTVGVAIGLRDLFQIDVAEILQADFATL
jgi:hypothetical protein